MAGLWAAFAAGYPLPLFFPDSDPDFPILVVLGLLAALSNPLSDLFSPDSEPNFPILVVSETIFSVVSISFSDLAISRGSLHFRAHF